MKDPFDDYPKWLALMFLLILSYFSIILLPQILRAIFK